MLIGTMVVSGLIAAWLGRKFASAENESAREARLARLRELEAQREREIEEARLRILRIRVQGETAEVAARLASCVNDGRHQQTLIEAAQKRDGIGEMAKTADPYHRAADTSGQRAIVGHFRDRAQELAHK